MKLKTTDTCLLKMVREHVRNGTYVLVKHALERKEERGIRLPDVLRVLEHGIHEHGKDIFDVKRQVWKYAIRGNTINGLQLRVIVAFQEEMVIITVMKIGKNL